MNTKSKVGRPAKVLVYPSTPFTIDQLFEMNKGTVKWELSVRQHVKREIARRGITELVKTVKTGKVGKPAYLYTLTKFGQKRLTVATVATEVPTPVTQVPISMEAPAAPEAVAITAVTAEAVPVVVDSTADVVNAS